LGSAIGNLSSGVGVTPGQVTITKKVNNFVIDASAYASVQSQGPPAPSASVGKSLKQ